VPSAKSKRVNALLKREWENATTPEARERVLAMIERAKTDVNYWEQLGTAPIFPPMGLTPALGLAGLTLAPVVGPVVAGGLGLYGAGQLAEGTSRYLGDVPGGVEQILEGGLEVLPFAGALKKGAKGLLGDLMADVPVSRNTGRYHQPGGAREGWVPPTQTEGWVPPTQREGWVTPTQTEGWVTPTQTEGWMPPSERVPNVGSLEEQLAAIFNPAAERQRQSSGDLYRALKSDAGKRGWWEADPRHAKQDIYGVGPSEWLEEGAEQRARSYSGMGPSSPEELPLATVGGPYHRTLGALPPGGLLPLSRGVDTRLYPGKPFGERVFEPLELGDDAAERLSPRAGQRSGGRFRDLDETMRALSIPSGDELSPANLLNRRVQGHERQVKEGILSAKAAGDAGAESATRLPDDLSSVAEPGPTSPMTRGEAFDDIQEFIKTELKGSGFSKKKTALLSLSEDIRELASDGGRAQLVGRAKTIASDKNTTAQDLKKLQAEVKGLVKAEEALGDSVDLLQAADESDLMALMQRGEAHVVKGGRTVEARGLIARLRTKLREAEAIRQNPRFYESGEEGINLRKEYEELVSKSPLALSKLAQALAGDKNAFLETFNPPLFGSIRKGSISKVPAAVDTAPEVPPPPADSRSLPGEVVADATKGAPPAKNVADSPLLDETKVSVVSAQEDLLPKPLGDPRFYEYPRTTDLSGTRRLLTPEQVELIEESGGMFENGVLVNASDPAVNKALRDWGLLWKQPRTFDPRAQKRYLGLQEFLSDESRDRYLRQDNPLARQEHVNELRGRLKTEFNAIPNQSLEQFVDLFTAEERNKETLSQLLLEEGGVLNTEFGDFMRIQSQELQRIAGTDLLSALEKGDVDEPILKQWLVERGHVDFKRIKELNDVDAWELTLALVADETSELIEAVDAVMRDVIDPRLAPLWGPKGAWKGAVDAQPRQRILRHRSITPRSSIKGESPNIGSLAKYPAQTGGTSQKNKRLGKAWESADEELRRLKNEPGSKERMQKDSKFRSKVETLEKRLTAPSGMPKRIQPKRDHASVIQSATAGPDLDRLNTLRDRGLTILRSVVEARFAFLAALSGLMLGQQINNQEEGVRDARFG
jgi:hypothetical protein